MNLFIMLPLGLGDAIISNGMVRELAKRFERVYLPSYVSNSPSMEFMFSDLPNVIIQEIYGPNEIYTLELFHKEQKHEILRIGTYNSEHPKGEESFDQLFYRQADVAFSKRWDAFKVPEAPDFKAPEEPFALICDDVFRGFKIDDAKVDPGLIKVRLWKAQTIFHLTPLFNKASEIHAIDSAPMHLAESIPTNADLFFHLYARNAGPYHQAKKRKSWTTIN